MSHLDEARIEDEYVGWVPCDVLRGTLSLDLAPFKIGLAYPIHIQPEFCNNNKSRECRSCGNFRARSYYHNKGVIPPC